MNRFFLFLILFWGSMFSVLYAQKENENSKKDSLYKLLSVARNREKIDVLNHLAETHLFREPDSAFHWAQEAYNLAEKITYPAGLAEAQYILGKYYSLENYPEKAIQTLRKVLEYERKQTQNDSQVIDILHTLSAAHARLGEYTEALTYALEALNRSESANHEKMIARSTNDVASLYMNLENYDKAREYVLRSIHLDSLLDDKEGIAMSLNSLGAIAHKEKEYDLALENYDKALKILQSIQNEKDKRLILSNIGEVYKEQGNSFSALSYYADAYQIDKKYNFKNDMVLNLRRMAEIYVLEKEYTKALSILEEALSVSKEQHFKSYTADIYFSLSMVYEKIQKPYQALHYARLYADVKDKIYHENSLLLLTQKESQYQIEHKEKEIALLTKDKRLQEEKLEREEMILNVMVLGLALILVLVGILYKQNQEKQKANTLLYTQKMEIEQKRQVLELLNAEMNQQKEEIEAQRDSIEGQHHILVQQKIEIEKKKADLEAAYYDLNQSNEELSQLVEALNQTNLVLESTNQQITSSIQYAKRIQESMLPPKELIKTVLPELVLLFMPRDIVSGDFYWFSEVDDKVVIAAADCTGHGVPGAFMSMLGEAHLSQIVNSHHITAPSLILKHLNLNIRKALKQEYTQSRDGMDISIAVIDKKEHSLRFAGAKGHFLYVYQQQIHKIEGNKIAIGGKQAPHELITFTEHCISLQENMMFYLYSDGYQDQFGGKEGTKFLSRRLRQLFISIAELSPYDQEKILSETFKDWKGTYRQIDDVMVVGFRVSDKMLQNWRKNDADVGNYLI